MIRKPQLNLLTVQSDSATERRLCDYIMENMNNEEMMLEAIFTLERYFSQKQSLSALSLKSTEILSHVLNQVLHNSRSLDVKLICVRIYARIMSSDSNHVLKNRLITAAEPELICMFLSADEAQATIWDCFAYHLMSTRKLAPIVRLLVSCVFAMGWNRQKRVLCIENLHDVLKENPEATLTTEDLSIVLMFILEKLTHSEPGEEEEIAAQVLKIFTETISVTDVDNSIQLLPTHLQSIFATIKKEEYRGLLNSQNRESLCVPLPALKLNNDVESPGIKNNSFSSSMDQLNLHYCIEFATALKQFFANKKKSPNELDFGGLESEFPCIMQVSFSLAKTCNPPIMAKLLDTMQIILEHIPPQTAHTHLPLIIQALVIPLSDPSKHVRQKLSTILVSLCRLVPPGVVVDHLAKTIHATPVPKVRLGILRAIIFSLLLFPGEELNPLYLCREVCSILCTDNNEQDETKGTGYMGSMKPTLPKFPLGVNRVKEDKLSEVHTDYKRLISDRTQDSSTDVRMPPVPPVHSPQTKRAKRPLGVFKMPKRKDSSYVQIDQEKRGKGKQVKRIMNRGKLEQNSSPQEPDKLELGVPRRLDTEPRLFSRKANTKPDGVAPKKVIYGSANSVPIFRVPQKVRFAGEKHVGPSTISQQTPHTNLKIPLNQKVPVRLPPLPKPLLSASSVSTQLSTLTRRKDTILKSANIRRRSGPQNSSAGMHGACKRSPDLTRIRSRKGNLEVRIHLKEARIIIAQIALDFALIP
ncbi:unnamed protein product [Echinostoma caproni]|uniref:Maestro heat-like repeat-containing protein family member 1 n=1 Tax=Echinostoma caproni TaxID=27848 RepID=A0A183AK19_9TREM|nr:unnamed protein product [Echinostoma caproni]